MSNTSPQAHAWPTNRTRPLPHLPCLPRARQSAMHHQPLQRLGLIPRRAHPDIAFFRRRQDHWHGLWVDRFNDRVRRPLSETRRPGEGRGSASTWCHAPLNAVQIPANANGGRSPSSANQTTSFFFVSGFGSGAYSAKLFAGTRHRFSGFSHPRQCGEEVLRIFVTGGPPVCGGGGIPQRIMISSRSPSELRTTGAG